MKQWLFFSLFIFLGRIISAQPVEFSTDDLLATIQNKLRLDSLITEKIPQRISMSNDIRTLIQADSVKWYGVEGKFTLMLTAEKSLEHLEWDSYQADSNAYYRAANDMTHRFGVGISDKDEILTFNNGNGLCISLHKDEEGRFRIFFVNCRKKN
ncbi:MAG TPA: hypothetical protein VFO76_05305 [Candidatus Kapabacteria bacterium]|nr:hypothetical protein [Candidatus Kapabacteria bacterium]